jgi:hypothetical protein
VAVALAESVAVTVKVLLDTAVGIPASRPAELKVIPAGKASLVAYEYEPAAPPVTEICCEYGLSAVALVNVPAAGVNVPAKVAADAAVAPIVIALAASTVPTATTLPSRRTEP